MNPYEGYKIRGPYLNKDNRKIIQIGNHAITTYARYLLEVHLGRLLTIDEHAHHINGNPLDNRLENLKVINITEHHSLHKPYGLSQEFVCPTCEDVFTLKPPQITRIIWKRKNGMSLTGPFCSSRCSLISHNRGNIIQQPVVKKFRQNS